MSLTWKLQISNLKKWAKHLGSETTRMRKNLVAKHPHLFFVSSLSKAASPPKIPILDKMQRNFFPNVKAGPFPLLVKKALLQPLNLISLEVFSFMSASGHSTGDSRFNTGPSYARCDLLLTRDKIVTKPGFHCEKKI